MENVINTTIEKISIDRKRTNLFKSVEQQVLANLCEALPDWLTPDRLTFIGFIGSLIVFAGFWLAQFNVYLLSISIMGFAVNWFGDSLDGRIAYYRNISRKWYGFALDLSMDWISVALMGLGFYYFLEPPYKILALAFVIVYAWSILLALLRYKITNVYTIDTGIVGPTELRIGISLMLIATMLWPQSLVIIASVVIAMVFIVDVIEFNKVLTYGDIKDRTHAQK